MTFKKRIFNSVKTFFGEIGGVLVSYFGNDTFVLLIDEPHNLKGNQMVTMLRERGEEFSKLIKEAFDNKLPQVLMSVGNFYRGKDGIALAYEEAKITLQLGMSIDERKPVFHVDDLGMIAVLARKLCQEFVNTAFI
jgi:sugar diacid utilization regulator